MCVLHGENLSVDIGPSVKDLEREREREREGKRERRRGGEKERRCQEEAQKIKEKR